MSPFVPQDSWRNKFAVAARGVASAVRSQRNFVIHFIITAVVVLEAILFRATLVEWGLLGLCIGAVLVAELFNTALEHLARAVTREEHPEIRDALDTSSGAVLVAAIIATLVGVAVLAHRAAVTFGWL